MRLLKRHKRTLLNKKLIIFALGPITTPYVEKEWLGARAQLDKELNHFPWMKPLEIKIFGGRFDLSKVGFFMKKFAGNIPPTDAMDIEGIRDWASGLKEKL
jgi:menaquinone-dependent protoporphyrinogen IX oxidase